MSLEQKEIEICQEDNLKITKKSVDAEVCSNTDLEISGKKKEYSIVGDSLYASMTFEQAPQWLTSIIDNVVNSLLATRINDLNRAIDSINTSLMELEVAKNQYQELINIDSRIDSVLASRLQTLNATIQQNAANITELDTAKVTPNEALAISIDHINAQINNGKIHSLVTELNNTIANNEIAAANRIETLESVYDQNESKVRTILSTSTGEYTSTANALTELEVNLNEELYGATGLENTLKAEISNEGKRVESKFAYNSSIGINGKFYKSGFGLSALTTSGGTGTEADPYNSEFWINAQKFKFTNDDMTGQVAPFTIDASGISPQIAFNGKVSFTNLTNVPQLGSTPQEVVDAVNAGNTTTIDGGKITTGSITANQIKANSVSADRLTSTNGQSTVWIGGGLVSSNFNGNVNGNIGNPTQGFRLSSNAAGTSTDPNIYGAYIKGGVIQGSTFVGSLTETTVFNDFNAPAPGHSNWNTIATFTAYPPNSGEEFKLTACLTYGAYGGNWPNVMFKVFFNGVEVLGPIAMVASFSGSNITVFIKSNTKYTNNVNIMIQATQNSGSGYVYPQTNSSISCMTMATAV